MINSNTYSDVYEILSYMDKSIVMKIPIEILENIKEKRNKKYVSNIDPYDLFNPKNVNGQTIEVLSCLDINFWMDNEKKKRLEEKYNKMELEYQNALIEKYNPDDIFKNRNRIIQEKIQQSEETRMTVVQEKKWYKKIFNLIKNLFHSNK